ncbi:MAG TPA: sulfatase [Tepidisphaeraceae bacterium]|nr:sulfatase [Tepidisphaeraceae bacterium]
MQDRVNLLKIADHMPFNFLLLVGEDTGVHHGCYGGEGRTPHLDGLAANGIRFDAMTSTTPVCAPARSSLITGCYPWSIGTHHMRSTLLAPPRLFTQELRDAGYYVNWWTKTDFNFTPPSDFTGASVDWTDDLRHGRLPAGRPFLLYRNYDVTHESTMWAAPDRDPQHWGMWKQREANAHLLPGGRATDPATVRVPAYLPDTPSVRGDIARYLDALAIQDAQVGQTLAALDASPYRDNTVVIYLADHGRGLVREKRWCYAGGLHVPLIVRLPGGAAAGTVRNDVISTVDIAPTILAMAGVPAPSHYQGHPRLGASGDQPVPPRSFAFAGRDRMDEGFDRVRACRDVDFHYVRNDFPHLPYAQHLEYMERQLTTRDVRRLHAAGQLTGPTAAWMAPRKPAEELYDVRQDPEMVHNLATDPSHRPTLERMRAALAAHLANVGDLGELSERDLIHRGLVADRLDEYRARLSPDQGTVLEMPAGAISATEQIPERPQ